MTLVDTSVWANHFRSPNVKLVAVIDAESAGMHPFVLGERALGNLKNRATVLDYLNRLPQAPLAQESEVHHLLESRRLWSSGLGGTGLGWIDLHLLASAAIAGWDLLTADRAMKKAAEALGLGHPDG
ncbi:MAG TPA: PIN domain-containing protein [Candidatus Solibacter sp.]|nr:PIN domain-containing protein [Candidatus Solibacter sp.]